MLLFVENSVRCKLVCTNREKVRGAWEGRGHWEGQGVSGRVGDVETGGGTGGGLDGVEKIRKCGGRLGGHQGRSWVLGGRGHQGGSGVLGKIRGCRGGSRCINEGREVLGGVKGDVGQGVGWVGSLPWL